MTPDGVVRRYALGLPEAYEDTHRGHTSFRVNKRIFAMLRPEPRHLIVKLGSDDQHNMLEGHPGVVIPGVHYAHHGLTRILLDQAGEALVALILRPAWLHVAPKRLATQLST